MAWVLTGWGRGRMPRCIPPRTDARERAKLMDEWGVQTAVLYPNVAGFGMDPFLAVEDPGAECGARQRVQRLPARGVGGCRAWPLYPDDGRYLLGHSRGRLPRWSDSPTKGSVGSSAPVHRRGTGFRLSAMRVGTPLWEARLRKPDSR